MSGGSLDYAYSRVDDLADIIQGRGESPLHKAFAAHLRKVSKALHDLEWVWSFDYAPGREDEAIRAVLAPGAEIECARDALRKTIAEAQAALAATS